MDASVACCGPVFAATVFISAVVQPISIVAIAASRMFRIGPSLEDAASAYRPRNLLNLKWHLTRRIQPGPVWAGCGGIKLSWPCRGRGKPASLARIQLHRGDAARGRRKFKGACRGAWYWRLRKAEERLLSCDKSFIEPPSSHARLRSYGEPLWPPKSRKWLRTRFAISTPISRPQGRHGSMPARRPPSTAICRTLHVRKR